MDRSLRQFLAIADAGSITAASRALNITQPTLTVNMQKLEKDIGVPLFERTPNGVALTDYGETFRQNVRIMQRLYDNALAGLKEQHDRQDKKITLACGFSWWTLFVRGMVQDYNHIHPSAPIRVNLADQIQCMDLLLSGDALLTISNEFRGLNDAVGVDFIPVSQSPTGYFVRQGHALLGQARSRAEIATYPLAMTLAPDNRFRAFIDESKRLEIVENTFAHSMHSFSSNSLSACIDYVSDGDAVLMHSQLFADELTKVGLREVTQLEAAPAKVVGVYVLSEKRTDVHVAALVERTLAAARAVLPAYDVA